MVVKGEMCFGESVFLIIDKYNVIIFIFSLFFLGVRGWYWGLSVEMFGGGRRGNYVIICITLKWESNEIKAFLNWLHKVKVRLKGRMEKFFLCVISFCFVQNNFFQQYCLSSEGNIFCVLVINIVIFLSST